MIILLIFAFFSGLVTIAAPCIWPLLPIILSSSANGGHRKPLGITVGITSSFAIFTLTLSYIVSVIPIDLDALRLVAVGIIAFFGFTLIIPQLNQAVEGAVSKLSGKLGGLTHQKGSGFLSGLITGLALGIVWTPCAGPILATIATLAATQAVNFQIVLVTIAYVVGVGIPLFLFALLGNKVFAKSKSLSKYTGRIQQVFGLIMIAMAFLILTNQDKVIQARLLDAFPQYSKFLINLESNDVVKSQLDKLRDNKGGFDNKEGKPMNSINDTLPKLGNAPEFVGITNWLNSSPLTMEQLKGKVVLIDIWTYTCINCIRTLPHITGWYEKYNDQGFVVIGVHTPEFEFEKKTENVLNAIKQFGIKYPVAQDNDFATWNAYNNRYWPAKYLIDADGNVRYTHFGEGEYDVTEDNIKKLLAEAGKKVTTENLELEESTPTGVRTPETYLGSLRAEPNSYLQKSSDWKTMPEYSESVAGSTIDLQFNANKVFLVITSENTGIFDVFLDGYPVEPKFSGKDVKNGIVEADSARLYELIDLKGKTGEHKLKLNFQTPGIRVFAFTFG